MKKEDTIRLHTIEVKQERCKALAGKDKNARRGRRMGPKGGVAKLPGSLSRSLLHYFVLCMYLVLLETRSSMDL